MKYLIATLLIIVALIVGGCTASDPIDNIYTKNIYPGNGRFDIGSRGHPYINAYINNMYAGNADLGIADADVLTVGGVPVSTSSTQWTNDTFGIHYDAGNVGINTDSVETYLLNLYSNDGTANAPVLYVGDNSASAGAIGVYTSMVGAKTDDVIGLLITNATTSHTASKDKYGLKITSSSDWDGVGSVNYAIYIATPVGGETAYALFTEGGTVHLSDLSIFANNAAAVAGGLIAGDLYRTGDDPDLVCIVH